MSAPPANTAVSVSAEVAETHVKNYYDTLERDRNAIASFHVPSSHLTDGKTLPSIIFNGNVFNNAEAFQEMYKKIGSMHFDVQSLDCQVINPKFSLSGSIGSETTKGKNMTVLVLVSGSVKVGSVKESEMKAFSETFVLITNREAQSHRRKGDFPKEWLIQSQNFRFVA